MASKKGKVPEKILEKRLGKLYRIVVSRSGKTKADKIVGKK
jgi:hypothetical protein